MHWITYRRKTLGPFQFLPKLTWTQHENIIKIDCHCCLNLCTKNIQFRLMQLRWERDQNMAGFCNNLSKQSFYWHSVTYDLCLVMAKRSWNNYGIWSTRGETKNGSSWKKGTIFLFPLPPFTAINHSHSHYFHPNRGGRCNQLIRDFLYFYVCSIPQTPDQYSM